MKFSERRGIKSPKVAQIESIDDDLRNGLWNALTESYWNLYHEFDIYGAPQPYGESPYGVRRSNLWYLIRALWIDYFRDPIDEIDDYWRDCRKHIRDYFFDAQWWEVYDFVEFIANTTQEKETSVEEGFINNCNYHLQRENSAYRFVSGEIVEITSKEEIESVESAIAKSIPYSGVQDHLRSALALYSDKSNPDYRNSMKESISSIEALAKKITGDDRATLGKLLKRLEQEGELHPALKEAFSSLYGYTSDADGIRHALLEEDNLTKMDARFMLVCCSAFVNYIIETVES